jgi:hypothetical protein
MRNTAHPLNYDPPWLTRWSSQRRSERLKHRWFDNEPVEVLCFCYCPITEAVHALPLVVDVRCCDRMPTKWRALPWETPQPHVALANVVFWCPPAMICLTQMQSSALTRFNLDNVIICHFLLEVIFLSVALCPTVDSEIHRWTSKDPSKKQFLFSLGCTNAPCCFYPIGARESLRDPDNKLRANGSYVSNMAIIVAAIGRKKLKHLGKGVINS